MKGISPLVASVLLVAITMSVAGILAFWVSSFTGQTLPQVNKTVEECRFSNFEIWSCSFDSATETLTFTLHNIGPYEIQDLQLFIVYNDSRVSDVIKLNKNLGRAEYKSFRLTASQMNVSMAGFSGIIVGTGVCPELSKQSGCLRS
ncbi:MAG: archaellin/type IV pilin N-terminal domain-containing protein [Candidatus Aenigmatarchaeota archaeon]